MNQLDYKKYIDNIPQTGESAMVLRHIASGLQVAGETSTEHPSLIDLEVKLFHELKDKVNPPQEPEKTESVLMSQEVFESHKTVLRCPLSRLAYNNYRGWLLPDNENGSDEGYLVEYLDGGKANDSRHKGYISWSPKAQFDNGYTAIGIRGPTGQPGIQGIQGHEVDESLAPHIEACLRQEKSLGNTDVNGTKNNVSDLVVFGNVDMFELICKASSKNQGWMKSTKGLYIEGLGTLVQVTTQQGDNVAEALQFIPGAGIRAIQDDPSKGREFYNMYDEKNAAAEQKRLAEEKNDLLGDRPYHKESQ